MSDIGKNEELYEDGLDEIMPNDGESAGIWLPEEDENSERKKEVKKEKSNVAIAAAVAGSILEWFDSILKDYETVDAVQKTKNTYKATTDEAFTAHHIICLEIANMQEKFKAKFVASDVAVRDEDEDE